MLITKQEFAERLEHNRLRIALVGMSNSGKSTCTTLLARETQFAHFEVDEAINRALGIANMEQAATWMGYPFDEKYAEHKRRYLSLEQQFTTTEIPTDENFVLDTTGSVIYGPKSLHDWIQSNFLIVSLKVSEKLCQILINDYFTRPKTVIWGSEFSPAPDEDPIEAMKRCYPQLLANRSQLYSELADVEISAETARDPGLTASQFLTEIKIQLPD